MKVIRLDSSHNLIEIEFATVIEGQGLRLDTAQNGTAAALIFIGVGLLAGNIFISPLAVAHQCQQITLGAATHIDRGGLACEGHG